MFSVAGRYALASAASFCVSAGGPVLLHEVLGVPPETSVAVAYCVAFFFNFAVGKYFVYQSNGPIWKEFISFASTSLAFRGLEYGAFIIAYKSTDVPYFIINTIILFVSSAAKFFVFKFFVYKKR